MDIIPLIILQGAIIFGVIYGIKLIIKILKDQDSAMKKSHRLIMPLLGISILIFYFIKHIIEL